MIGGVGAVFTRYPKDPYLLFQILTVALDHGIPFLCSRTSHQSSFTQRLLLLPASSAVYHQPTGHSNWISRISREHSAE
jgi:hypothetical protein